MRFLRRTMLCALSAVAVIGTATPATAAAVDPVTASPYLYSWGRTINAVDVMRQTGVKSFTLAFVLSDGGCNPKWDGTQELSSKSALINQIRGAGGEVVPSFGGWSGNKLGDRCGSASALAGAYQKVIDAFRLTAIDIDIENTEFHNPASQDKVLGALKIVKDRNPGVKTVITMGTAKNGPDADGQRLIRRARELGANVDVWTLMPFNFGGGNMVTDTISAVDNLRSRLSSTFGYSAADAYRRSGISSMNGKTDQNETVTAANYSAMRDYARRNHLGRFTFWALNRDFGNCGAAGSNCSGINQGTYEFTRITAGYTG
ncbi:chitinase [Allokutzneria multivorans]|uniref:Chitinase n=1 Tax=Allokutzneria multivorans TaxID=1142134 RepID=A0ABP7U808_9PSEU